MRFLLRVGKDILENSVVVGPFHCNGCNPLRCSSSDREVYRCIYDLRSLPLEGGYQACLLSIPCSKYTIFPNQNCAYTTLHTI